MTVVMGGVPEVGRVGIGRVSMCIRLSWRTRRVVDQPQLLEMARW